MTPDGTDTAPPTKPNLYVVARFLDRLSRPGRTYNRSTLQAATRVNYDIFRRYCNLLEEKGYLDWGRTDDGADEVRLTEAGREAHDRMMGLLDEWLDESRL